MIWCYFSTAISCLNLRNFLTEKKGSYEVKNMRCFLRVSNMYQEKMSCLFHVSNMYQEKSPGIFFWPRDQHAPRKMLGVLVP